MCTAAAHLFVYGTLRGDDRGRLGRAQRRQLQRESRALGAATMPGHLVDLGAYPGLVETAAGEGVVHGEVVALDDPDRSFRWLDAYEGVVPGEHEHNEYVRHMRVATLASGERIEAWVYVHLTPGNAQVIAGGDWLRRSSA